jgi:hypothetical protein
MKQSNLPKVPDQLPMVCATGKTKHLAGFVGLIHRATEILSNEQLRLPPGVVRQAQVAPNYVLKQTHRRLLRKHLYLHGFKAFKVAVLVESLMMKER